LSALTSKGRRPSRAALASCAALFLPFLAAADSRVQGTAARATLEATAHLDFKIIIPRVLSMDMADGPDEVRGAQTVAIYTNSHNATLAATIPASDRARGNIILNSAARKIIAQNAVCAPGTPAAGTWVSPAARRQNDRVVCTASMP
jgi:hypothetical protein